MNNYISVIFVRSYNRLFSREVVRNMKILFILNYDEQFYKISHTSLVKHCNTEVMMRFNET